MTVQTYTVKPVGGGWQFNTTVGFIGVQSHYRGDRAEAVAQFEAPFRAKGLEPKEVAP